MTHQTILLIFQFLNFRLHIESLGCWWSKVTSIVLEELFRNYRWSCVGCGLSWSNETRCLQGRVEYSVAWRTTRWSDPSSLSEQTGFTRSTDSSRDQRRKLNLSSSIAPLISCLVNIPFTDPRTRQDHNASLVGGGRKCRDWWQITRRCGLVDRRYREENLHIRLDSNSVWNRWDLEINRLRRRRRAPKKRNHASMLRWTIFFLLRYYLRRWCCERKVINMMMALLRFFYITNNATEKHSRKIKLFN